MPLCTTLFPWYAPFVEKRRSASEKMQRSNKEKKPSSQHCFSPGEKKGGKRIEAMHHRLPPLKHALRCGHFLAETGRRLVSYPGGH